MCIRDRRTAEAVCASTSELLEAWGNPISIALVDDIPAWARSTAPLGMVSERPVVAPDAQGFSAGDLCACDAEAVSEALEAALLGAPSPEDPAAPVGEKAPERRDVYKRQTSSSTGPLRTARS